MADISSFDKYRAYILSQKDRPPVPPITHPPFITLSRLAGAGAGAVARLLAEKLNARLAANEQPWVVFDKNLITKVLEDKDLPQELARHIREDKDTTLQALVGEILGLHPSMWTLFHHTSDTILKLARVGRCIIVGRGGNIITAKLKSGIHARLVAPEEDRMAHLKSGMALDDKAASKYLHEHDEGRRRYIKNNFDRDIDDPLLYHAVLNTGLLGYEATASVLAGMIAPKL